MNNRFVKIGEAAKLLGVSVQALRNWEMEGKIMPSHRTPGGQRMYNLAELLGVTVVSDNTKNCQDKTLNNAKYVLHEAVIEVVFLYSSVS